MALGPRVKPDAKVLVVHSRREQAEELAGIVRGEGYEVVVCTTADEALALLEKPEGYDLVLAELLLPGEQGWELLKHLKEDGRLRYIPVVVLVPEGAQEQGLKALDMGAEDYLCWPLMPRMVMPRVRAMLRIRGLYEDLLFERFGRQQAQRTLQMRRYLTRVMGGSGVVQKLADILDNVVTTDTTVLLEGESGTGKGMLAEVIHRYSKRAEGPFVVINCSAYPETLLASELFGHEKGAFTGAIRRKIGRFEQANGGTIFLDEVGDISPLTQLALLRVIQDRQFERVGGEKTITVDVRIIAATNRPLKELVERGEFREDLFYRLNVVRLELPPLRERPEDIPFLANYFLQMYTERLGKPIYGFSRQALGRLMAYQWPGNVRELRNVVEHAVLMCHEDVIGEQHLPPRLLEEQVRVGAGRLAEHERQLIASTLEEVGWNKYKAAKLLGISRSTLYSKIARYGLKPSGGTGESVQNTTQQG